MPRFTETARTQQRLLDGELPTAAGLPADRSLNELDTALKALDDTTAVSAGHLDSQRQRIVSALPAQPNPAQRMLLASDFIPAGGIGIIGVLAIGIAAQLPSRDLFFQFALLIAVLCGACVLIAAARPLAHLEDSVIRWRAARRRPMTLRMTGVALFCVAIIGQLVLA